MSTFNGNCCFLKWHTQMRRVGQCCSYAGFWEVVHRWRRCTCGHAPPLGYNGCGSETTWKVTSKAELRLMLSKTLFLVNRVILCILNLATTEENVAICEVRLTNFNLRGALLRVGVLRANARSTLWKSVTGFRPQAFNTRTIAIVLSIAHIA